MAVVAGQPKNCKCYSFPTNPRAAIYTNVSTQGWFIEALSTRDITVFQAMINNKSTLLVSAYLDITLLHVIPPALHKVLLYACLLYTSPSPRDRQKSRMPSSA